MLQQVQKSLQKNKKQQIFESIDWKSIHLKAHYMSHPPQTHLNSFARAKEEIREIADETEWHFMTDILSPQTVISDDLNHVINYLKNLVLSPNWNSPKRVFVRSSFKNNNFEIFVLVARGVSKNLPFVEVNERLTLTPYQTSTLTGWVLRPNNQLQSPKEVSV